ADRARDVAGGKHDTALASTHDHGLVGEREIVALLDGGIEGIAIDVGNGQRVDLGMAQQARRAAARAAGGLLRRVAPAIAAEAGHVPPACRVRAPRGRRNRVTASRAPTAARRWYHAPPSPRRRELRFPPQMQSAAARRRRDNRALRGETAARGRPHGWTRGLFRLSRESGPTARARL